MMPLLRSTTMTMSSSLLLLMMTLMLSSSTNNLVDAKLIKVTIRPDNTYGFEGSFVVDSTTKIVSEVAFGLTTDTTRKSYKFATTLQSGTTGLIIDATRNSAPPHADMISYQIANLQYLANMVTSETVPAKVYESIGKYTCTNDPTCSQPDVTPDLQGQVEIDAVLYTRPTTPTPAPVTTPAPTRVTPAPTTIDPDNNQELIDEFIDEFYEIVDSNVDDIVTYEELKTFMTMVHAIETGEILTGDDLDEFEELVVEPMFDEMDVDGNGYIDEEEYVTYMVENDE